MEALFVLWEELDVLDGLLTHGKGHDGAVDSYSSVDTMGLGFRLPPI